MDTNLRYIGTILLNSQQIDSGTLSNATFYFNNRLVGVDKLAVLGISMINKQYDVSVGDQFKFQYNATPITITIDSTTAGNYTATALASFLQTQLRTATGNPAITVVYDSNITRKLTFDWTVGQTGSVKASNASRMLGLNIDNDLNYVATSTTAQTNVMTYPVALSRTLHFDFCSSSLMRYARMSPSSVKSAYGQKVLHRLINTLGYGSALCDKPLYPRVFDFKADDDIANIDIQILNQDGSLAILNNAVWEVQLGCYAYK